MRPLLFILSFVLFTNTLFAQTEPASYKQVADKVVEYYNQASYESIFAMFSTDMQNALPLEKTQAFF
jgi:hypothetical protein